MNSKKSGDISGGAVVVGIIITAVVFACIGGAVSGSSSSKKSSSSSSSTYTKSSSSYSVPSYSTPKYEEPKSEPITWHCIDVTSYNKNAYDDNQCTSNTGEVRLVSDSQAVALDPTYSPGKSGAYYYNSK
jgi:hypothetical protein